MADLPVVDMAPADLSTDHLLNQIAMVKAAAAQLDGSLAVLLDELSTRMESGDIDPSFNHNDWSFNWCAGRARWSYPQEVGEIEALLNATKKRSQADGSASRTLGNPFWTIKPPQS